jgi:hypothetical protein
MLQFGRAILAVIAMDRVPTAPTVPAPLRNRRGVPSFLLALVVALSMLAIDETAALAATPVQHIDATFEGGAVCGVPVTTQIEGHLNVLVQRDGSTRDTSRLTYTWTNAEGEWLRKSSSGSIVTSTVVADDGSLTFVRVFRGIAERVVTRDGTSTAFDRGRIAFTTALNLTTGEITTDVTSAGPHPEAMSEFALFCAVVIDVLG